MHADCTPAAARALDAARAWARRHSAPVVAPIHLLLGLIEEDEGRAATLLRAAGIDASHLRSTIVLTLPAETSPAVDADLPFAAESQAALEQARDLVFGDSLEEGLATEQILFALLRFDTALRAQVESLGLSWQCFEQALAVVQEPRHVEEPVAMEEPLRLLDVTERMDSARVLDASANRAREALRVIEDYCRFVLDDAVLCGELKRLRHRLAKVLRRLDPGGGTLIAARETLRDVGTRLSTAGERSRRSLLEVVQANLKRLQEALRTLEEFGKLHGPEVGAAMEKARYRIYTLERAIVLGSSARQRLADARLYVLISGAACTAALDWTIAEAAAGGAQIIQLREKDLSDRALLERATSVRQWTRQAGVLFIMNDRPDIARLVEADGVHLGQDELPVKEARRILGPDALIGVSTHDLDQLRQAVLDGASYIGVGPTFPSGTKTFATFPGLEFVRQARAATSLPAFVIGGVTADNIAQAVQAGARRVAVSQAICRADDPRTAARTLRAALDGAGTV